ncbi:heavy metal translocating P-type ATPase [uncultured Helicobacter sp.]|uniref:heavy metal translocating P-type ATPase n=1 Tax=uncultured Helicobacter sp. TaxID=175537 RepID=UPI002626584B|nr:heavy metal translocating P-type ATPase [uncultured Helicobacter sp.]
MSKFVQGFSTESKLDSSMDSRLESSSCKCSHCQRSFPLSALIHRVDVNGRDVYFCCNGCEGVYMLLHQSGFGGFYERLGSTMLDPATKQPTNASLAYLDEQTFLESHTKPIAPKAKKSNLTPELREVGLIIEGIHCAACIWLNEHILGLQPGIHKVHINYTNNKAKIIFDPALCPLSKIFSLITSIGYRAHIYDPSVQEIQLAKEQKIFFTSFVVGVFCTMSIMMVAIAQYVGYFYGMAQSMKDVLNLISCLLATPVLFYTGRVFYSGAYYGLRHGYIGMDFLVAFGASLTFLYSIYASITRSGESYFESVAMIILFVFSGKFLEMRARRNAGDSLDRLHTILPSVVEVESSSGLKSCDVKSLAIGDRVHIPPGGMLPCDGIALESISLDMSSLSGESLPVQKHKGDELLSGSIVLERSCIYEVRKPYEHSMMSVIITMLEESLASRPRIQNLANALAKYFSRIVLLIALGGFLYWWHYASIDQAIIITISVIVIACPCALALATPIASVVGISRAYRAGLLFKEARFLETLARAKTIVLDKTGTLTLGKPRVQHIQRVKGFDENLLAHFVHLSSHPISRAVAECFHTSKPLALSHIAQQDSRGIYAKYGDLVLLGGSLEFLIDRGVKLPDCKVPESSKLDSMSVFGYSVGGELVLLCYLQDSPKPHAKELIATLQNQGKNIVLLSGDRSGAVESIARELGIKHYVAHLLPAQKAQYIKNLRIDSGKITSTDTYVSNALTTSTPTNTIVMIGDGLNDILALKAADVGISMGAGSDIAIAQSDIVVLDDSLPSVHKAFQIANQTYRRILQNLALSLVYNALLIPLALAGFVIPLVAALSMSISSLIVVANSTRKG